MFVNIQENPQSSVVYFQVWNSAVCFRVLTSTVWGSPAWQFVSGSQPVSREPHPDVLYTGRGTESWTTAAVCAQTSCRHITRLESITGTHWSALTTVWWPQAQTYYKHFMTVTLHVSTFSRFNNPSRGLFTLPPVQPSICPREAQKIPNRLNSGLNLGCSIEPSLLPLRCSNLLSCMRSWL